MDKWVIYYDRVANNGVTRHYSRTFDTYTDAFKYAREKGKDERNKHIRGIHHEERYQGVVFVHRLAL